MFAERRLHMRICNAVPVAQTHVWASERVGGRIDGMCQNQSTDVIQKAVEVKSGPIWPEVVILLTIGN